MTQNSSGASVCRGAQNIQINIDKINKLLALEVVVVVHLECNLSFAINGLQTFSAFSTPSELQI